VHSFIGAFVYWCIRLLVHSFIGAFVLALIGMSYYVIFRIFSWGSLYTSHGHPDDDGIEELDNKLEFYRKLHQGAALENPETI
jgi:hypothetical protein